MSISSVWRTAKLPHSRSKTEGTMDEERRLFYVAVTRAMKTLSISHCGGRKKYGQVMPCHPSPFGRTAGGTCGPFGCRRQGARGGLNRQSSFDAMRASLE